MFRTRLAALAGQVRKAAAGLALTALAACATQGNSFEAAGLNHMIPGQTTRAQAEVLLHAPLIRCTGSWTAVSWPSGSTAPLWRPMRFTSGRSSG